jgi:hypothetical protein
MEMQRTQNIQKSKFGGLGLLTMKSEYKSAVLIEQTSAYSRAYNN